MTDLITITCCQSVKHQRGSVDPLCRPERSGWNEWETSKWRQPLHQTRCSVGQLWHWFFMVWLRSLLPPHFLPQEHGGSLPCLKFKKNISSEGEWWGKEVWFLHFPHLSFLVSWICMLVLIWLLEHSCDHKHSHAAVVLSSLLSRPPGTTLTGTRVL